MTARRLPSDYETRCSFCKKTRTELRALILGPKVSICGECIELSISILLEEGFTIGLEKAPS